MHFTIDTKRFEKTPTEWLPLAGQIGELCNEWSGRGDILAYVGEGAGAGIAAALFNPIIAEMELNRDLAFGEGAKPEFITDMRERDGQFEQPVASGAILHEAMHAKHTHFDFSEVRTYKDRRVGHIVELLEEIRVEARAVEHWPKNRAFMRACAMKLVVSDMESAAKEDVATGAAMQLLSLMMLTMGRVSAGTMDYDDVTPVREAAHEMFGEEVTEKLRKLWCEGRDHRKDTDWKPLRRIAEKMIKLLEDEDHDMGPSPEELDAAAQAMADKMGELIEKMGEMTGEVEIRAMGEANEQAEDEETERQLAARSEKEAEKQEHEDTASKIFAKSTAETTDYTSRTRGITVRNPTDAERAAAIALGKQLEKARYRDRVVVKHKSALPPGRLNGRGAMQGAAQRSRGLMVTAEPWSHKSRFHTEDPNLIIGMMTDISGSMSSAMEPMGVANWVFSEAGRRCDARIASVYYGNNVTAGLSPGQHLDQVHIRTAPDGTERFDLAFKALNGKLNLLDSTGARLLVVVSDLHYTSDERVAAHKWFKRCTDSGVGVIVLPFDAAPYYTSEVTRGLPITAMTSVHSPVEAAMEIGQAAVKALEAVGNRG